MLISIWESGGDAWNKSDTIRDKKNHFLSLRYLSRNYCQRSAILVPHLRGSFSIAVGMAYKYMNIGITLFRKGSLMRRK